MLSALAVSGYIMPPPAIAAPVGSLTRAHTGLPDRLASLSDLVARGHAALKEQRDRFGDLFEQARALSASPEELRELAQEIRVQELKAADILLPQIERLRANLDSPKGKANTSMIRSWRRLAEESLEIAATWLELYQNLQICLFKFASELQAEEQPHSPVFSNSNDAAEYLRKLVTE